MWNKGRSDSEKKEKQIQAKSSPKEHGKCASYLGVVASNSPQNKTTQTASLSHVL